MEMSAHNRNLLFVVVLLLMLEAYFFSSGVREIENFFIKREKDVKEIELALASTPITARAVSVYDLETNKVIFGKNDNVSLPIASLSKIMTVATALSGENKERAVSLSKEAIDQSGDFGLFVNEKWKIKDLAKIALITSANDTAFMLGQIKGDFFVLKINEKAKKIGAENSAFLNFTGLDILPEGEDETLTPKAGAYASAQDVNLMSFYILRALPDIAEVTTAPEINLKSESGFEHNFKNTNIILDKIPNLLFSKTGFTEIAGGNLSIIFENKFGNKIAVTLLGSTFEERFSDMEKIVNVLYNSNYGSANQSLPKL